MQKKSARKRAQGRPARADAEATRALIVAAARELLRHKKPARVSREEIARAAGVDPGLVRYYFGDKNALFPHVIRAIGDDLNARLDALPAAASPLEQLRLHAGVWVQVFVEDPHFHELVVDRVFHGEGPEAKAILDRFVQRAYPRVERILAAGMKQGEIRRADPRFVYLAFIGLCEFFATAGPLVERLFERDAAALSSRYAAFVAELLADGLRGEPRTPRLTNSRRRE